jgi:hypothetical protein
MAAPRRSRRLVTLAVVALMALAATADGARNSSATATSTASVTATPRTSAPVSAASDASDSGDSDSSESKSADDRSASEDGSSETGVVSSSTDADEGSDASGSSSLADEPGVVHAASFSDSGSGSDAAAASTSAASEPVATAATEWTEYSSADDWKMTPVTAVHARVQADEPEWDAEHLTFVSMYGDSFSEKFRAALDTANTASVEGALMYVQAEGINVQEQSVECERKNGMAYVVFYALQLTQSTNSIALYQSSAPAIEYCPYVAMDSGRCTPTDGDSVFPEECYQYHGLQGETDIGPCVGGETKDTDFRAPYPETYWFSLPNSCPLEERADKTDECREEYPGGLCAYGSAPDGENCTFSYRILGYISIDDLVGITSLRDNSTGEYYANYSQFCEAGGVEFSAVVDEEDETVDVEECLDFWDDPTNSTANSQRAQLMVTRYAELVAEDTDGRMVALPSVDELTASNPPCYLNNVQCADAEYGCRRVGYFQVCEVCSSSDADDDDSCVVSPYDFTFPDLEVIAGSSSASTYEIESQGGSKSSTGSETASDGGDDEERDASGSNTDTDDIAATSNSATPTTTAAVTTNMWLAVASASAVLMVAAL